MEIKPTKQTTEIFMKVINEKPTAFAIIKGENHINGTICFYSYKKGTFLNYEINNLPQSQKCQGGIFGFHIHAGESCQNDTKVPYEKTKGHLNPKDCPHPYHLGDLPPIFAHDQKAWAMIYIDKFSPKDIIGRTVVIHENIDDFHGQPAGNSGTKIACGEIKSFY